MRQLIKSAAALCAAGLAAASLAAVPLGERTVSVRASAESVEAASVATVSDTAAYPTLRLRVNDPLMQVAMQATHDGALKDWARVNFLPASVTVTSVTVYAPGTSLKTHYPTVTLDGRTSETGSRAASETYFAGADRTYVTAAAVTYTFDPAITLTSDTVYDLTFNPAADASGVTLAGFKAMHDHKGSELALGASAEYRPYVTLGGGSASMKVYSAVIDGDTALSAMLPSDFEDSADSLVELRFTSASGGTVTLDRSLKEAALFAYSKIPVGKGLPGSAATEQSGTAVLKFPDAGTYKHTGPMTLSGNGTGGITLQAATSSPSVALGKSAWNPKDFLVLCDIEQALLMPTGDGSGTTASEPGWFETHEVLIPAGRSWYVSPPEHSQKERQLPTVVFGSADSRLVLAADHAIPAKYRTLMTKASGTLVLSSAEEFTGKTELGNVGLEQHFESHGNTKFNPDTDNSAVKLIIGSGTASDTTYHQHGGSTTIRGGKGDKGADGANGTLVDRDGKPGEQGETGGNATVTLGAKDVSCAALMIYDGTFVIDGGDGGDGGAGGKGYDGLVIDGDDGAPGAPGDPGTGTLVMSTEAHGLELVVGGATDGVAKLTVDVIKADPEDLTGAAGNGTLTVAENGTVEASTVTLPVGANHTVLLDGGTFAAPAGSSATLTFDPGALRVTANGGTLDAKDGSLTVDRVTGGEGSGTLTAKGTVTITTLTDYDGTVQAEKEEEDSANANKLNIGTISGTSGTVTVGYLGYKTNGSDDDGAALKAVTEAAEDYQGTLAFTSQYQTLDFTQTEIRSFPYALAFSNGASADKPQHIIMRLDQYDGTTVRWPENPQNIKLTLIETGSYGGEAFGLPAIPSGVTLKFASFNADGSGYTVRGEADYVYTTDENGVTGSLTWEDPVFTGNSAWIDCEFNGTSANTGWVTLGSDNAMLAGTGNVQYSRNNSEYLEPIKQSAYYTDSEYPFVLSDALWMVLAPYVDMQNLTYPETWSVAVRLRAPDKKNTCLVQIGVNHNNNPSAQAYMAEYKARTGQENLDSLILATGDTSQELIIAHTRGGFTPDVYPELEGNAAAVKIADLTSTFHVVSMNYDGTTLRVYLDGAFVTGYTPDDAITLGPGLQIGSLLGDKAGVGDTMWEEYAPAYDGGTDLVGNIVDDSTYQGAIDYLRFYKGQLTEAAMRELAHEAPPVIKNVRYVRTLAVGESAWVKTGEWQRQEWTSGSWTNSGATVAEPAEGCEVYLISPTDSGTATLAVNVKQNTTGGFYSADRLYSRLTIEGGKGDTVRIEPCADWQTATTTDGDYTYGTIRFTGGAGQAINDDSKVTDVAGLAGNVEIDGGVCRLDWDGVTLAANAQVTMKAGLSLVRGEDAESKTYQLTGPVSGADAAFVTNPAESGTAVWLQSVEGWRFYDETADAAGTAGLFARAVQTPGRLYLDLKQHPASGASDFSAQAWYRYGYAGTDESETLSGLTPIEASPEDFKQAIAFQIRVPSDGAALTMDQKVTVRNFVVDRDPKSSSSSGTLTLTANNANDEAKAVTVTDEVITHAVLDIAGGSVPALTLKGTELHGSDGELVMDGAVNWPLETSSVGRLTAKAGKTLTLSGPQNLRTYNTVLAAQPGAKLVQDGAANALLGADIELGEGAAFVFAGQAADGSDTGGVRLSGALRLTGKSATLSGGDGALFAADGGFSGPNGATAAVAEENPVSAQKASATLTVEAAEGISWSTPTSALTDLGLTKTGAGTVDFRSQSAPTVTGPVTVAKGTLLVAPSALGAEETAGHTGAAVGHFGLTVAAGATLGQTSAASTAGRVLACIAAGQRLSGTGTVDGILRLTAGSVLKADDSDALTAKSVVTEAGTPGDITVQLGENYGARTVFLTSLDGKEETVRRRMKSVKGEELWDTIARHVTPEGASAANRTEYYARPGGVPKPADDSTGAFDTGLEQELTDRYRSEGRAYIGETKGRRPSKTENLTSAEISGAERCFTGISLFADRAGGSGGSFEYVDGATYLVGFEYGITAMTVVTPADPPAIEQTDGRFVILEVTVESYLKPLFGAAETKADFRPGTDVEVTLGGAVCTQVAEVADLEGKPLTANRSNRKTGKRYLAIPFSEDLFGTGDGSTKVSVRAVPPAAAQ